MVSCRWRRLRYSPPWSAAVESLVADRAPDGPAEREGAAFAVRRNATMETAAGVIIVVIVGVLGVMVPAAHQSAVRPFDHTLSRQAA